MAIASLQAVSYITPRTTCATFINPSSNFRSTNSNNNLPTLRNKTTFEELIRKQEQKPSQTLISTKSNDELVLELLTISEVAADRAEMHAIIGAQRNNWNHLLTGSINSLTLAASLMAGIALIPIPAIGGHAPHMLAFKIAAMIFFGSATAMMMLVNKVQPSQLAEEQRKATQLWKQLDRTLRDTITLQTPSELDVKDAMNKVATLERAYPLPITTMLEKFPARAKPARWWPKKNEKTLKIQTDETSATESNGWDEELERELRGVLRVLRAKDGAEYVKMGNVMLNLNKRLASSGPALAGAAAISCGFIGTRVGALAVVGAVVGGALATVVNSVEHGGQVGMVFEMFRNCAGYYKQLEEEIEGNLGERDVRRRENGEVFRVKIALQLGRGLNELKDFAPYASPSCKDEDIKEFAGKLF